MTPPVVSLPLELLSRVLYLVVQDANQARLQYLKGLIGHGGISEIFVFDGLQEFPTLLRNSSSLIED